MHLVPIGHLEESALPGYILETSEVSVIFRGIEIDDRNLALVQYATRRLASAYRLVN